MLSISLFFLSRSRFFSLWRLNCFRLLPREINVHNSAPKRFQGGVGNNYFLTIVICFTQQRVFGTTISIFPLLCNRIREIVQLLCNLQKKNISSPHQTLFCNDRASPRKGASSTADIFFLPLPTEIRDPLTTTSR